jgi:hypothetical protein
MKAVQMKSLWNPSEYHMAVCTIYQQLPTNCGTERHDKAMRESVMQLHADIQDAKSIQLGSSQWHFVLWCQSGRVVAAAA